MNNTEQIKAELKKLRDDYRQQVSENLDNFSEESVRGPYLNDLLKLFNWNLGDISQVQQEQKLSKKTQKRLQQIHSNHKKPDYALCDRSIITAFLDAKKPKHDFTTDKDIAFQIRSYGWSAGIPFSIVSNFGQFGIYDTSYVPSIDTPTDFRVKYFTIDDLIDNLELYSPFFNREDVIKGNYDLSTLGIEQDSKLVKDIDSHFLEEIDSERLNLGKNIYLNNPALSEDRLNSYVQIIMNQILFVRYLEDCDIEPINELKKLYDKGNFWKSFSKLCQGRLFNDYDGAMFSNSSLNNITIDDSAFKSFITSLYGDTPYRFNVIDPLLIAQIYELYLGKRLAIKNKEIKLVPKLFNHDGSISTPYPLAMSMVEDQLSKCKENDLTKLKILDPNAGSGTFLISAFDYLRGRKEAILKRKLTFNETKSIITDQLFGVDVDATAIEVLRMGISLKLILSDYVKPYKFKKALAEYKDNFILGNTLIQNKNLPNPNFYNYFPINYSSKFPNIMKKGGFDFIFSNPPYIEPKYYIQYRPQVYEFLKKHYDLKKGKVDASLFFIKRYMQLLNSNGKLSIITQRRFFKTKYGKEMRQWLANHKYVTKIIEYADNNIFKKHITYVATLCASQKPNDSVIYSENNKKLKTKNELRNATSSLDRSKNIPQETLLTGIWSLNSLYTEQIIQNILKHPNIIRICDKKSNLKITVGPQVLDKKFFYLYGIVDNKGIFHGYNKLHRAEKDKSIALEKGLLKPVLGNEKLVSFLNVNKTTTYIIYPYNNDASSIISPLDIKKNYPLTWSYLSKVKDMSNTKRNSNGPWYGYTRKQNLKLLNSPKLFVPMTNKNITCFVQEPGFYGDNSNLNAIVDDDNNINRLKALAVIFNSEIFNLLAIGVSGDASNGYHKFNKQFLEQVPVPLLNTQEIGDLANLYDTINSLVISYLNSSPTKREYYFNTLSSISNKLNKKAQALYKVSPKTLMQLKSIIGEYETWLKVLTKR